MVQCRKPMEAGGLVIDEAMRARVRCPDDFQIVTLIPVALTIKRTCLMNDSQKRPVLIAQNFRE